MTTPRMKVASPRAAELERLDAELYLAHDKIRRVETLLSILEDTPDGAMMTYSNAAGLLRRALEGEQ